MRTPPRAERFLNRLDYFDYITLKKLEEFKKSTLADEVALKEESTRHFWNCIFNAAVESMHEPDRDREMACYTSKNSFLRHTWRTVRVVQRLQGDKLLWMCG